MSGTLEQPSARVQQTRQRIIQAALQEFSTKGYARTTTRAIAEAAGVSELTLFRHFATKKNLFLIIVSQFSALPGLQEALAEQITGEPRHDLLVIGNMLLHTLIARRTEILMALREAEIFPEVHEVAGQIPRRQQELLASYLRRQMELGHLRRIDPALASQAFQGMIFAYAIERGLEAEPASGPALEVVVALFVDIFLTGLLKSE